MRHFLHLLAFVAAGDAPPKFEGVNKMPPVFTGVNKMPVASEVAPVRPFPRSVHAERFNPSHRCENCGRTQFVISGWVGNGQHRHTCAGCGLSWVH